MKIAILGYGVEGQALAQYFGRRKADITICDENDHVIIPEKYNAKLGANAFKKLRGFDMVFRSPGIPLHRVEEVKNLTSLTEYFFENCPCPIIGVTGTKGKGTTSTLIYEILKAGGQDVYLGGNIGTPPILFLSKLKKSSIVILELSSFQTQTLKKNPKIAVILNVTSDHLDYHADVEEYREAKARLVDFQTEDDFVIANADHRLSMKIGKRSKGSLLSVSTKRNVKEGAQIIDREIVLKKNGEIENLLPTEKVGLIGPHNLENILPSVVTAHLMGVKKATIKKVVRQFKGLPHRLEKVAQRNKVLYYNDSFSTTPETSIAAINAFEAPIHLIAGGSEKHSDFNVWAKACMARENLKTILLSGQASAPRMALALERAAKKVRRETPLEVIHVDTMGHAMEEIQSLVEPGDVVLLSPACASFEEFPNYKVRGEIFRTLVKNL